MELDDGPTTSGTGKKAAQFPPAAKRTAAQLLRPQWQFQRPPPQQRQQRQQQQRAKSRMVDTGRGAQAVVAAQEAAALSAQKAAAQAAAAVPAAAAEAPAAAAAAPAAASAPAAVGPHALPPGQAPQVFRHSFTVDEEQDLGPLNQRLRVYMQTPPMCMTICLGGWPDVDLLSTWCRSDPCFFV